MHGGLISLDHVARGTRSEREGSRIGDFLHEIVRDYPGRRGAGWSKVMWDISTIAWLINEKWVPSQLVHSPIAQDDRTFSYNKDRHLIRQAYYVHRDVVFHDLFKKLAHANDGVKG